MGYRAVPPRLVRAQKRPALRATSIAAYFAPFLLVPTANPVLVACFRSAAVGRTARRLAVGNARYLPHFLQNALLVASISLYKLTS